MTAHLNIVARLTAALEAFHAGDQRHAVKIVEDLRRDVERHRVRLPYRCVHCGTRFEWPGQLDHHRRFSSCGFRAKSAGAGGPS